VADELGNGMVNIGHCYLSFLKVLLYIVILNVVKDPVISCRVYCYIFLVRDFGSSKVSVNLSVFAS
jgi:hypothetical protein